MKKLILISAIAIVVSSCATITGPGNQQVKIDTTPPGADVVVDGASYVSPAIVTVKGSSGYSVMATKKGYKNTYGKINGDPRILASVVGNIFNLTGVIGMAVDFLGTGAAYKMDPSVSLVLNKEEK